MRRRIALAGALATVAALAGAPAAFGQAPVIQGVDDLTGGNQNRWTPDAVTINAGDTVTWRFTGTQLAHNVKSTTPNWTLDTPASSSDQRDVTFKFDDGGHVRLRLQVPRRHDEGQGHRRHPAATSAAAAERAALGQRPAAAEQLRRRRREAAAAEPGSRRGRPRRRARALPAVGARAGAGAVREGGRDGEDRAPDVPARAPTR